MKKLILVAVALVTLLGAQPAPTALDKTVAVSITHVAFVPNNVTIQTGDVLSWANNDTVNHQLVSQAAGIGSPILKPNDTYSFTFTKAGNFTVRDALDSKFPRMTVTVRAAPRSLSLATSASAVSYGGAVTLSGKLSTGQAGVSVDVRAQQCGESAMKRIASVSTTTEGGAYTYVAHPAKTTIYTAKTGSVTSASVTVNARPKVVLSKIQTRKFRVRVYAADSLVGRAVVFQRYIASLRKWRSMKTVVLRVQTSTVTPLPGTIVSSVSFGIRLRAGYRVRAVMTTAAAAPCYIAGTSRVIRS